MNINNALLSLSTTIDKEAKALNSYVNLVDAKDSYIAKQNVLIKNLTDIYNCLAEYEFLPYWAFGEKQIKVMRNINPTLDYIQINLPLLSLKIEGSNFGVINLIEGVDT